MHASGHGSAPPPRGLGLPLAGAFVAVVAWSSAFVGLDYAVQQMSPGALVILRFATASACFLVLMAAGRIRVPERRDLLPLALLGLVGHFVYQYALSVAQTGITAGTAGILIALVPVMSALLGAAILREHLPAAAWLGLCISFAGVVLVTLGAGGAIGFEPKALLGVLAAAASAAYFVLQKPWLARYTALDMTAYGIWAGTVASLVFAPELPDVLTRASHSALLTAVYLGVVPTALGYTLWAYATARAPVAQVASLLYLEPVITFVLAWMLLGEIPLLPTLAGAVLALAGVVLVTHRRQAQGSGKS